MLEDIKVYTIKGKNYQIEASQQHTDGSLVVVFKPAPNGGEVMSV